MKRFENFCKPLLPALLLAVAVPGLANSRVFQWTDANGVIHYGDAPRGAAKPLAVKPISRGVDAGAATAPADSEACSRKREQLQRYSGASKVTETNALGETREYDEAQVKALIESSEAAVREACGGN